MYTSKITYQSLKFQVWEKEYGDALNGKCPLPNCSVILFKHHDPSFQCGHILPRCKGGKTTLENLRPICSNCNARMGYYSWNEYEDYVKI
jgi:5-methylcytosine-specific restriction endonuclease McrA